jgi:hypothetical protein
MIGGAQPKVLLTQDEDGNLHLDKRFEEVFGTEYMNYKLVREEDGLTKQSQDVMWLEFDENGKFKAKHKDIAVGRSLLMSPFSQFFTWQTTDIKEIIEQKENYVKFKTTNSIYELHETTNFCR